MQARIIAVASDAELQLDIPVLDLNNPLQISEFILRALHLK